MNQKPLKNIALACDHAGVALKQEIHKVCIDLGWTVSDLGTYDTTPVDYPDIVQKLANCLKEKQAEYGIIICGTGIGVSIAANRFPFIRAAQCHTEFEAEVARQHNNANVLCLGARVLGVELAIDCVKKFLSTDFEGGRHLRRLEKIDLLK